MFQGSRNVRSGEHFEALMAQGAPAERHDLVRPHQLLRDRADRVPSSWRCGSRPTGTAFLLDAVTQENLDNQRDVVKEEKRQRYDNQPYGNALIDVYAAVFPQGHPYHHPTIGSMEDLDAASLDDVHAFFRAHYGPDNTRAHPVRRPHGGARVRPRRSATSATWPASAAPRRPDHPQLAPLERSRCASSGTRSCRTTGCTSPSGCPSTRPTSSSPAAVALDCIGGLATSRLVRRLVRREQTALGAHATAWGFVDGASLGFVVLDVAPGTDPDVVEAAFVEELEGFLENGPTEVELEASLAQSERSWLSALASQEERADLISHHLLLHDDPDVVNTHLDRLRDVTAEQVVESARRWLRPDSRAIVAYLVADDASDAP